MDTKQIAELLGPFVPDPIGLNETHAETLSAYLDLLVRWNARINLTSVRKPEEIITRHFGESLFAASRLFPSGSALERMRVVDVGSGAGFPGLPIKIWSPQIALTLIEANQKKATFLREVIRKLALSDAEVFCGRAEEFEGRGDVVTLRAVERFEKSLPTAAHLVAAQGRLALLIGQGQVEPARELEPQFRWDRPIAIPQSSNRVLLIGMKEST